MHDYWEVRYFGDTTSSDGTGNHDADTLNDLEEFQNGTDPNNADTDGDGFNDDVELNAGTDPLDGSDFPQTSVPTLNQLGMIILSLLFITLGTFLIRFIHEEPGL